MQKKFSLSNLPASDFAAAPDISSRNPSLQSGAAPGKEAEAFALGWRGYPEVMDPESMVTDVMFHIGVPPNVKGYPYIREAILLTIEDSSLINAVTKRLYPAIAEKFSSTPSRVERAIRNAIELAWDRGDVDILNSYFGYTINLKRGKPTSSEFIAMIAERIRVTLKRSQKEFLAR